MFIAHLPATYICACVAETITARSWLAGYWRQAFWALMIGGIFPDLDLLYDWLVDSRQNHHHFPTHLPAVWLGIGLGFLSLAALLRHRGLAIITVAFVAGVFVHLIFDTPMGGIAWLYPHSSELHRLITLPGIPSPLWQLRFILQWSMISELNICLAALALFLRRQWLKKHRAPEPPEC